MMRYVRYQPYNYEFIRRGFGENICELFRKWTCLNYKCIRFICRLVFLKQCKNFSIFPTHLSHIDKTKFYLKNYKSKHNLNKLLYSTKIKILNIEIFDLHRQLHKVKKDIWSLSKELSDFLPVYIWRGIVDRNNWFFGKYKHNTQLTNIKKLNWLIKKKEKKTISEIKNIKYLVRYDTNNNKLEFKFGETEEKKGEFVDIILTPKEFENNNTKPFTQTNKKWFINLSNDIIPLEVSNLLQLGEGFSIPCFKNKKQSVIEFIKDFESIGFRGNNNQKLEIRNTVVTQLEKFINDRQHENNIQLELMRLLRITKTFFKDNTNIIFTKADKGNITVALDRAHYINSINEMLIDPLTYEVIQKNPIKNLELKLNNILKRWVSLGFISKKELFALRNIDCSLPKAYGLPKLHKENIPFRIIVSSIGTTLYSVADYLQKILHNSLPPSMGQVKNSFELFNRLLGMTIPENHLLISLDVRSLFTNIPSELVLEAISNRWVYIQNNTKITQNEFILAVKFIMDSTYFIFDNTIYKQIFGTPMGSPLSPVLADMVMQDLEVKAINNLDFSVPLYYRYVDDILLLTPADKVDIILNSFNNIHDRLSFTIELEKNRSINFLDLNLTVKNKKLYIDWYRKETCSGRYLHYYSGHPLCHKVGTIYGLTDRALLLSHPIFHKKNLEYVIKVLIENAYPIDLIFQKINHRIKTIKNRNQHKQQALNLEGNKRKLLILPYIKNISERINWSINKNLFLTGYRILNKLTSFIKRHKDVNKVEVNNNVVYKIVCNNCDASYVGQTKRQLKTRVNEHVKNIVQDESKHSVITKHILQENHTFDWLNVQILDFESNYFKRLVSEMIYIKTQSNGLNSMEDIECLDSSYFNLLTKIFNQ